VNEPRITINVYNSIIDDILLAPSPPLSKKQQPHNRRDNFFLRFCTELELSFLPDELLNILRNTSVFLSFVVFNKEILLFKSQFHRAVAQAVFFLICAVGLWVLAPDDR
jgi:hypothetical protein